MSKNAGSHGIKDSLLQLKCHFTWGLVFEDKEIPDLESRVLEEIEFLDTKYNVGIHNLLAYVKHLKGQSEEALQSLREAEDLIQKEHADEVDRRSLVAWGNYAWVYYKMGRLAEAQAYLDKVENTCKKLASPSRYTLESPEMDCEEGWALVKCGAQYYKRAHACFGKALAVEPENPEFSMGFAITAFRLDYDNTNVISLEPLRKAIRLNPDDAYLKVLLALKLQNVGQGAEGEPYIEEALKDKSSQTYVFQYASKFYRKKGCADKALQLLKRALEVRPNSAYLHYQAGLCYRAQMIQRKQSTNMRARGQERQNVERLVQSAMREFQETLRLRPTFEMAYVYLAQMHAEIGQYREAEEKFQKALSMNHSDDHIQQDIHYHYGRFLQFHMKSEDNAITHYLKGLKIEEMSFAREKLVGALEKLAERRVHQNVHVVESVSLLGLSHKLKGEEKEALLCYEKALRLSAQLNPEF